MEGFSLSVGPARVRGAEDTTQVSCAVVTAGFLDMLGVQPVLGRGLVSDDFKPGAPPVAIVSYKLWRAAFGGEPDVLGNIARPQVTYTDTSFQLVSFDLVGGYALQPRWADGHSTGIYSFTYLRRLGEALE